MRARAYHGGKNPANYSEITGHHVHKHNLLINTVSCLENHERYKQKRPAEENRSVYGTELTLDCSID